MAANFDEILGKNEKLIQPRFDEKGAIRSSNNRALKIFLLGSGTLQISKIACQLISHQS
jgi:hypothetical protein